MKKIHYYCKLFTSLLKRPATNGGRTRGAKLRPTEGGPGRRGEEDGEEDFFRSTATDVAFSSAAAYGLRFFK